MDYDTAYGNVRLNDDDFFNHFDLVYYQRMAYQARFEFYNPKPGEVCR